MSIAPTTTKVSDAPTPLVVEPPYPRSPKVTCPPVGDSESAAEATKPKKKKSKGKGGKDDVRKGDDRLLRKLNVGPRPSPVQSPTLDCPEPDGDVVSKGDSSDASKKKKKTKVHEDRHDPSKYDDDE